MNGIIDPTTLPGWPAVSSGLMQQLGNAGVYNFFAPDGLHVSDVTLAQSVIAGYAGSADELTFNQNAKLADLATLYQQKYDDGFNYVGTDSVKRTFQIDPVSQGHIDGQATSALGSIINSEPWDANTYFIAADNSQMPVPTAQDMRAFALAAHGYVSDLIVCNRDLKDQINAAPDMATLSGIDIAAGWPANP